MAGITKKRIWIKLVTFMVITAFLCENIAWAGGGLPQGNKLAGESAFKRVEKYLSRQGDVGFTFNDKLALAAILKELNEVAYSNDRVILRKLEEINRGLGDTNIRLEEAVHREVLSNGQTIDAVVVTINGRRWRRIYLNYKKLDKPQLEEIGIKTKEDLVWLKEIGTDRVWIERKGLRPLWTKVSDVIRFMPEDYGYLTVVREVIYNDERYIAKSTRSIEWEVRFIIPQSEILLYLNGLGISGIPVARHFIELENGRRAILFDKFPPGKTLEEKGIVSPDEALDIILKITNIVKRLHEAGVYHWDINPSNIWIADTGEVILFDFDLAFRTEDEFYRKGLYRFGTADYISVDRTFVTRVADEVYSLGMTLDFLLQSNSAIPAVLKKILEKAISKGLSGYKTVDEFITDIEAVKMLLKHPQLSIWQEEINSFTPAQQEIFQRALGIKGKKIAFDIEGTIRIELGENDEMGGMDYTPWTRPLIIGLLANNELMFITAGGRDWMEGCIEDEKGFLFKLIDKGRVPLYCREDILERLERNRELFDAMFSESNVLTREGFLLRCGQLKLPELFGFDFLVDDRSIMQLADVNPAIVKFLFHRYGGSLVPDWLIRVPSYTLGREGIYFLGLGGEDNTYLDQETPEPVFDKLIRRTVAPIFERLEGAGPKQIIIQHFWAFETAEVWDHTQEEISRMTRNDIFRIMKEAVVKKVRKWLHLLNAQLKPGQVCEVLIPYPPPHYAEFMKDKPPKGIDGELVRVTYEDLEPADESLPNEHAKAIVDIFLQTIRTKAQNCKDLDEELVLAVDTDIGNLKEYAQELIAELRKLRIDNVRIFAGPGAGLKGQLQKYLGDRKDCIVSAVLKNSNCSLFEDMKDKLRITAVEDSDSQANYIPIIPIIELAIKRAMGEDVADSYRWLTNVRDMRESEGILIIYLFPKSTPVPVDELRERYRNEAVVLSSA